MMKLTRLVGPLAVTLLCAAGALADPPVNEWERSIFRVDVGGGSGTGWLVNDQGYVATNWHVVDEYSQLVVLRGGTDESYNAELVWRGNSERDLALLRVPGLTGTPFKLNTEDPERGQTTYTAGFPGLADSFTGQRNTSISVYRGTVSLVEDRTSGVRMIQHDTRVNAGNSGGPLLDECGRVHGLTSWSQNTLSRGSDDVVWASVHIAELARQMDSMGIAYQTDNSPCALESSGETGPVTDEEAREQVSSLEKQVMVWGIVLGALLIITLVLALRRPRERIVKVIEEARRTIMHGRGGAGGGSGGAGHSGSHATSAARSAGVTLSGFAGGQQVNIQLPLTDLRAPGKGVSLGRSLELCDQVLNDGSISRRHARLSFDGRDVQVEDLNSTNGTTVDGNSLAPFQTCTLRHGSRLQLGNIELAISIA